MDAQHIIIPINCHSPKAIQIVNTGSNHIVSLNRSYMSAASIAFEDLGKKSTQQFQKL